MVKLPIKWGKQELSVDVEESMSVEDFKQLVYSVTNVPTDRMKFLGFAGGLLKDGDDLGAKLKKLKSGAKIQLVQDEFNIRLLRFLILDLGFEFHFDFFPQNKSL